MGELLVEPLHNVYKVYRKVNLVNPYLFAKPFVSTWRTSNTSVGSSTSTQVKLPLIATGSYNFVVDWGDNTNDIITVWNQTEITHTYLVAGDYNIKITGVCTGWQFNNTGDRLKLLSISSWGKLKSGNVTGCFYGCSNLNLSSVTDLLDLSGTGSMSAFFRGCTTLTTINRINEWNTSSVSSLSLTFAMCTNFNQNIGNWNVSSVSTFSNTFLSATNFNNGGSADINNWILRTTGTVNLSSMFSSATNFNQNIGSWNTVNVTNTSQMFQNASRFNQNIGSWNTASVTTMNSMFLNATDFNQNIGNWDISNVSNLGVFMQGKTPATFSTANLDAIYNGWSTRPVVSGISISFGTAKYTVAGQAGRDILDFAPNNWTIVDGGI